MEDARRRAAHSGRTAHKRPKEGAGVICRLLPRYGRMTGRLPLRATATYFSDPQRGSTSPFSMPALGSAKFNDLYSQARLAYAIDPWRRPTGESPN
jgi:hypothetical protein